MELIKELHEKYGNSTNDTTMPRLYALKRPQTYSEPVEAIDHYTNDGIPFHLVPLDYLSFADGSESAEPEFFGLLMCANGWASSTSEEQGIKPSEADDRQRIVSTVLCIGEENVIGLPFVWQTIICLDGDEPTVILEEPKGYLADKFHAYLEACRIASWVWYPTETGETE